MNPNLNNSFISVTVTVGLQFNEWILYRCKSNGAKTNGFSNLFGSLFGAKQCTEPEVDPPVSTTCKKLYSELALGNIEDLMHHTVLNRVLNETMEYRINNKGWFMPQIALKEFFYLLPPWHNWLICMLTKCFANQIFD